MRLNNGCIYEFFKSQVKHVKGSSLITRRKLTKVSWVKFKNLKRHQIGTLRLFVISFTTWNSADTNKRYNLRFFYENEKGNKQCLDITILYLYLVDSLGNNKISGRTAWLVPFLDTWHFYLSFKKCTA